jgi:hypothetical protein
MLYLFHCFSFARGSSMRFDLLISLLSCSYEWITARDIHEDKDSNALSRGNFPSLFPRVYKRIEVVEWIKIFDSNREFIGPFLKPVTLAFLQMVSLFFNHQEMNGVMIFLMPLAGLPKWIK